MSSQLAVGITIAATLGAAYRSVFKDARGRFKELGDSYASTNRELASAGGLLKYKRKLDEVKAHHAKVGSSADKMLADAKKAYAGATKAAGKYGIEIGNVIERQAKLQKQLKRVETERRRLERKEGAASALGAIRGRMLGVAGGAYAAARMVSSAMDREEQGQYLRTVITGPDRDAAVGRAMDRARGASRAMLASDEEMLEIQYALHSAGFDEAAVDEAEERVHKIAALTRGSAGQVGETFAVTWNNMAEGMAGSVEQKMNRIGNVLAKTQFQFQIRDFGQLSAGMKNASAAAIAAKVPLEDMMATMGLLNSAGVQGSEAGTAFRAMIRTMGKASEEFGFQVVRTESGAMDLVATLQNFKSALGSDDVLARIDEMVDASDGRISAQDAITQLMQGAVSDDGMMGFVPLLEMVDKLVAARGELDAAAQSHMVEEEYARFLEGGAGQWKMLGQNVRQVGEIFASTLLPQVTAVTGSLARQAGRIAELIERYPWAGRLIGGLALGFGAFAVGVAAAKVGVWAFNAAMLANPIGLVVAGLVAAGAIIYSLWDPITERVGALWEKIKGLGEVISKAGRAIKNSLIGKAVMKLFGVEDVDAEPTTTSLGPGGAGGRRYRSAGSSVGGRSTRARTRFGRGAIAAAVAVPVGVAAAPVPRAGDTAPAALVAPQSVQAPQAGDTAPAAVVAPQTAQAPQAGDTAPAAVVAPQTAQAPQAGDTAPAAAVVTETAQAPDLAAMQEEVARIGKLFETARAGAVTPQDTIDLGQVASVRDDVRALAETFDISQAPGPPTPLGEAEAVPISSAPVGVRAGQPAAAPAAPLVFHQTFHFHGLGPEAEDEIVRIMERIMRRASVDADLAAEDTPFLS